jgi:ABC-2 type transport system ATP-binding protein
MLDEPVNGLDPDGIRWMRGFLRALAAEGRAVLISSHLMHELEDTADHLVVIGRGRLIADSSVPDLLSAVSGEGVVVRTPDPGAVMAVLARAGAAVASTADDSLAVSGLAAERVAALLAEHRLRLYELSPLRASLEDAYLHLTRDLAATADFGAVAQEG